MKVRSQEMGEIESLDVSTNYLKGFFFLRSQTQSLLSVFLLILKPHNSDGTQTHCLLIEISHLVSGLKEVLYVSAQKEFRKKQSDKYQMDLFRAIHIP